MIKIEAKYYEIYDEISCNESSNFDHFLVTVGTTVKRKLNSLHEVHSYLNILCDIIYEDKKVNIYKYEELYYKLVYYGNICFKFAIISREDVFKYVRYLEATAELEIVRIKRRLKKNRKLYLFIIAVDPDLDIRGAVRGVAVSFGVPKYCIWGGCEMCQKWSKMRVFHTPPRRTNN